MHRGFIALVFLAGLWMDPVRGAISLSHEGYNVFPGDDIQEAIELAAKNPSNKVVRVHAGEYKPSSKRQALIWLNGRHDGLRVEAVGSVTLTAANADLSSRTNKAFPAVVNHVVYFGDGIASNTVLRGFRITGANGFLMRAGTRQVEPNMTIPKNLFFFSDGGAIKVFGRSSPTIQDIEVVENFTSPCGAGISIQQEGFNEHPVVIENCRFLRNRAQATGAAVDLLAGSSARLVNCLFAENASNMGEDPVAKRSGERPFVNSGVMTIFGNSRAELRNCTFTANRNGVDDMGGASSYIDCIFYRNNREEGLKGYPRYELAVNKGAKVITGCFFQGTIHDVTGVVSGEKNVMDAPPPEFDKDYVPRAAGYRNAGYRPRR